MMMTVKHFFQAGLAILQLEFVSQMTAPTTRTFAPFTKRAQNKLTHQRAKTSYAQLTLNARQTIVILQLAIWMDDADLAN
jgi:hypothetical protein